MFGWSVCFFHPSCLLFFSFFFASLRSLSLYFLSQISRLFTYMVHIWWISAQNFEQSLKSTSWGGFWSGKIDVAFDLVSDLAFKSGLFSYVSSALPRCGWDSFLDQHRHRDSLNGGDSKFMCLFIGLGSACLKISLSSFQLASSISEVQI